MSPEIRWNENLPSDGSIVRASEIRDLWAALGVGLDESLEWRGVAEGQLRAGAAPSFVTTEANIASLFESTASSTARLAFASDTSRLWTLGLAPTNTGKAYFAGGPQLLEHIDQVPQGHVWLIGSGTSLLVAPDGDSTITYNSNGQNSSNALVYETPPKVFVISDNTDYMPVTGLVGSSNFTIQMHPIQEVASNVNIRWVSSGTSTI
ncbi:hypothetical protein LCGC14_0967050 [marine sediment metagenome]|uniref:Uncharacterized protein n=1 Tax=marine sediment metagenome TaxID=412755 RepID=A0A0F9QW33_9ZZZZ